MSTRYTEGPFGIPMKDKQARALEPIIKALPKDVDHALRRTLAQRGVSELLPESRCDVSWITVEAPDHVGDLVLTAGMDDSIYQLNPLVTLNHRYDRPPVGRSLWRRRMVRPGDRNVSGNGLYGVKAKTFYPPKPGDWPGAEWPPDVAFALVQAGLLAGKSIGFLPLQLRPPSADEVERQPQLKSVRFIIEKWLLLEYACCYLPMQPFALVEEVAKSLTPELRRDLNLPDDAAPPQAAKIAENPGSDMPVSPADKPALPFTTARDLERALYRRLTSAAFSEILKKSAQRTWKSVAGS
jgi:hypothetical protein